MLHRLLKLSPKSFGQRRFIRDLKQLSPIVDIHPEIYDALTSKRPVVALESTIITHGMPHPYNLETAIEVEKIVREQGAFPATIAILKGRIKIGLSRNELMELADKREAATMTIKTSRRDLPYVLGTSANGGTTVASTIICAELCGIKIFATGGIGGVHRSGEVTMDVSADLVEMGRSPVVVVSSGVKSILDIPRTMEFLETQGVCVATYQVPDREFPAFYTRASGVKAPYNFADAEEAAMCIDKARQLGLRSGMLIGVPVPEAHAMNDAVINDSINDALAEAQAVGVRGKEVTPFILAAVAKITAGKSLQTNMSLIKNNARVAAQIAVALERVGMECEGRGKLHAAVDVPNAPVVIGGSILDVHYRVLDENLQLNGATYKSETKFAGGGVGRNIAEGLQKLNGAVSLISAFGNDQNGEFLRETLPVRATGGSFVSDTTPTANCAVILDKDGDFKLAVGDMTIHKEITPELIRKNLALLERSPLIVIDSNLSLEAIEATLLLAAKLQKPVFYEPTDSSLAGKPFELDRKCFKQIKFISPNLNELRKIAETLNVSPANGLEGKTADDEQKVFLEIAELCDKLKFIDNIIVTVGGLGMFIQSSGGAGKSFFDNNWRYKAAGGSEQVIRHYPGKAIESIVNASGAGDAFCAGFIAGMLKQKSEAICVSVGFQAAIMALMSKRAVPKVFFDASHECWRKPAPFVQV